MTNPFKAIKNPEHAALLANAFCTAHEFSDVHAALRFLNATRCIDLHGYVDGIHFAEFQNGRHEFDANHLNEVRELAHAFRDTLQAGIETLRSAVRLFASCNESFLHQFTALELLTIRDAWNRSEWEISPDQWTGQQVQEALAGRAPTWDDAQEPTHG